MEVIPGETIEDQAMRRGIGTKIRHLREASALNYAEAAVLNILITNWKDAVHIKQDEIALHEKWLGCHPVHEVKVLPKAKQFESTKRHVREIIRTLRLKFKIPILSDVSGYWLPLTLHEANKYLVRTERESRKRAASSIETYVAVRESLGLRSEYFEKMAEAANSRKSDETSDERLRGRSAHASARPVTSEPALAPA